MGFSAVVTTGIYCRPECSASPLARNVVPYDLAAAAEAAGFRACYRCRPYRSPGPVSIDAPELVCRAVRLISAGGLDGTTEAALAARLGVSARHLRRLFAAHLGVTPDQLARSRRAHFGRRLLDDTDLPVAQIAFASGFTSVRQFNRVCVEVFRATPTELRAKRRVRDRLVADGGIPLRLHFTGALDWPAMLRYFDGRAIAGVEHVANGVYRRTIEVGGEPGVLEIEPGGPDHLITRLHLPYLDGLIHLVQRARRVFNLDTDPAESLGVLGADPVVGPLARRFPGQRVPGTWDPFETGVRAIVGQQVSVKGASTITGRIVERVGRPVAGLSQLGLGRLFPTPAALADADLSGLGLTGSRAAAVRNFAGAVDEGRVPLDGSVGFDDLEAAVCAVPGLGPWTAHYLALRMGEPDAFPASDLGLKRAAGVADVGPMAEAWRPFRAQAAVLMWRSEAPVLNEAALLVRQ